MPFVGFRFKRDSMREFLRACERAEFDTSREMFLTFGRVGNIIRIGAVARTLPKHAPTAGGYQTRVQFKRVKVQQSESKTTGMHPEWGSWQMRKALLPAMWFNMGRIRREFERGTERVCRRFEG
jgi:hypothetical protein